MQDKQREWLPKRLIRSDFFVVLSWLLLLSLCCYYCIGIGIDRLINYVIYATFRTEVLYYATMGKVALLLQKIENREPITVGIGE